MPTIENNNKEEQLAIENIFGNPPGWILNWGISSIFFFVVVCLGIAAFVRYPDKLYMSATVRSINPPIAIISKTLGEIDSITFTDKQYIHKGALLTNVRTTLNNNDLKQLENFISKYQSIHSLPNYLSIKVPKDLELGVINGSYTLLVQSFEDFQNTLQQNAVFVKIASLQNEINQINRLNESLAKQENFYQKDLNLSIKDFKRNIELNRSGVISDVDKEKAESKLLQENRNVENFRTNRINNDVRVQQLLTEMNTLKSDRAVEVSTKNLQINQLVDKIKGEIKEWRNIYQIKAITDGTITLSRSWSKNQFINQGDTLLTILPQNDNSPLFAIGNLPQKSSGNLKIGQKATLDIQDYPSNQYGVLVGEVEDIALLPQGNNYLVKLKLPKDLKTTYNKTLPFKQNLEANVSIQTKEYSLLERLFQNILDIMKNKSI